MARAIVEPAHAVSILGSTSAHAVASRILKTKRSISLKRVNKVSGILKRGYFWAFYQPLRGALVDPKMLAQRAGSTIAGFGRLPSS